MSSLYLIRHGQAGLRQHYDTLSALGREQSYLLGRHLAARKVCFDAVYAGGLERQRQTAAEVCRAYREAGLELPPPIHDPHWSEFDLTAVFEELAPVMCAEDPEFHRLHTELLDRLADDQAAEHRSWTHCDTLVMRAWMEGRYPTRAESWLEFHTRVCGALETLAGRRSGETVAVFTSAMPIAIWLGMALGVHNGQLMRVAGVMYNSALTTMRLHERDLTLFTFNGVAHLDEPRLRTFR
ncbi:MAG TPA: histidine phosphatase family protein [Bryobacteraceae bacterium]|nr:histidine phosphatase family protein [Bryobacteraceae bacterium]